MSAPIASLGTPQPGCPNALWKQLGYTVSKGPLGGHRVYPRKIFRQDGSEVVIPFENDGLKSWHECEITAALAEGATL